MSIMLQYTLLGTKFRYKIKKTVLGLKELRNLDKKQEGAIAIIKTKVKREEKQKEKGGENRRRKRLYMIQNSNT